VSSRLTARQHKVGYWVPLRVRRS